MRTDTPKKSPRPAITASSTLPAKLAAKAKAAEAAAAAAVEQLHSMAEYDRTGRIPLRDPVVMEKAIGMMEIILSMAGMNIADPSIRDTPKRFLKYLLEYRNEPDYRSILGTEFDHSQKHARQQDSITGMVTQHNIPVRMVCEHHLLPALGKCAIGYIPNGKVVGLSKLARLVDAVGTKKPSLQERICEEVTDVLQDILEPKGVIVVMQAEHSCMACRGVNSPGIPTTTSCVRGIFRDVPQARSEFFALTRDM